MSIKNKTKTLFFCTIALIIFLVLQQIFIPKLYGHNAPENVPDTIRGLLCTEIEVDVVFMGTSVVQCGILPTEIYINHGLRTYNAGTSAQNMGVTYHFLKEIYKTKSPKMVVIDPAVLFWEDNDDSVWKQLLNNMPMGMNKIDCALDYAESTERDAISVLIPMLSYHDRWDSLNQFDFTDYNRSKDYYTLGSMINTYIDEVISEDDIYESMNAEASILLADEYENREYYLENEGVITEETYYPAYRNEIPEYNLEYLKKIKGLCEEKGATLLFSKIPSVESPSKYHLAWTYEKYNKVKAILADYNIKYYDMMYEDNIQMNWSSDSVDGGIHLNYNGAKKVSDAIAVYIRNNYEIKPTSDEYYNKIVDGYSRIQSLVKLQSENHFEKYIDLLKDEKKFVISFSIFGGEKDQEKLLKLSELGFRSDFEEMGSEIFVGCIDGGNIKYEGISDRWILQELQINEEKSVVLFGNRFGQKKHSALYAGAVNKNRKEKLNLSGKYYIEAYLDDFASRKNIGNIVYNDIEGILITVYDANYDNMIDKVVFPFTDKQKISGNIISQTDCIQNNDLALRNKSLSMYYLIEIEESLKR